MNVSEYGKQKFHKKSQSVDFNKKMNLTNTEKFKFIKDRISINNSPNKFNQTSLNFNKTNNLENKTNINFLSTFRKTGPNFFLNEFQKKFRLENPGLPFESFQKSFNDIMSEYKYEANTRNHLDLSEKKLFIEDPNFSKIKKKIFRKIQPQKSESVSDEARIKISIYNQDFKSPIRSYGVIWKNKIIHENMVKNFYSRQKNQYDEYMDKIAENEKFSKNTHKKLKITNSILNKNDDIKSIAGTNNEQLVSTPPDSWNIFSPLNSSNLIFIFLCS